ncbi:histidine kinase [Amycolatopsis sp. PS_44_ISF1]|uniref:sensor histidine kinase n=1 Tax=Amycolatopsis sp. PS_44_ISF1 TaxID=2974917 RepID=UPI0028E05DB8|nr:histidine kinase [Amycolatopsis sp. PS_44_ISF1]MDT8915944.1 histidine kinase [Amycolatopsis sp. PS_44_ISF1]
MDGHRGRTDRPDRWLLGWRRFVLDAGLLVYPLVTGAGIAQDATGAELALGWGIVAAFCAGYGLAAWAAARQSAGWFRASIVVLTLLFLAALPIAHANAFFLATVIVSLTAPRLPRYGIALVAAGGAAALVVPWIGQHEPGWAQAVALVFTALMVYAFAEAIRANRALVEAHAEVVRLASEAERSRIARDLHDLLGHSLTAITVKSNLARRLAVKGVERSVDEITAVETLSRQALADVRAAVSGYRDVTLAGELARGRELLRAAGILADLPTAVDVVDGAHQELFGWVVREGLTNVVRHACATRCTVVLTASELEVLDDGVGAPASAGSGLNGLRERVAEAGGRLEAGPLDPRGWRLAVAMGAPA